MEDIWRYHEIKEIEIKEALYGKQIEGHELKSKNIILVDDGVASGSTLIVVSQWIKKFHPKYLTIATPVCPKDKLKLLKKEVKEVKSLVNPTSQNFSTLSKFYQNFEPVTDDQVINTLREYK